MTTILRRAQAYSVVGRAVECMRREELRRKMPLADGREEVRTNYGRLSRRPLTARPPLSRVGQRARLGGGTDGSARIGCAILYGVRAVTAWNPKPMGHCSIANGSAASAWPGLARTHAHDPSTHAQAHTHARTRRTKVLVSVPVGGSARAHTPRRAKHSDCPLATNCDQRSAGTKPKRRSRGRTGRAIAASSVRRLEYTDTSKEGLA